MIGHGFYVFTQKLNSFLLWRPIMVPVLALVGRPNVGKSTLFNILTKSRSAIVAEYAGLTRDRQYGEAEWKGRSYIVIDT